MNNKQKNIGLLVGFLVSIFISYHFAIKQTVEVKKRNVALLKEKKLVDNAATKIQYLHQKNNDLATFLISNNVSIESSFQQMLLERITEFSKERDIDVIAFNQPHKIENNQTTIETYSFKLKGDFVSLLKLINYLEHQQLGELISINFEKKKNYKTNRNYLTATVFLQKRKND